VRCNSKRKTFTLLPFSASFDTFECLEEHLKKVFFGPASKMKWRFGDAGFLTCNSSPCRCIIASQKVAGSRAQGGWSRAQKGQLLKPLRTLS